MKTIIISVFMLLQSIIIFAQNDSISNKQIANNDPMYNYLRTIKIRIGAGIFIPIQQSENYIGNSPMFEINAEFPLKRRKSLEIAAQIIVPNQQQNFVYIRTIDTIQAKATVIGNFMLRYKKSLIGNSKSDLKLSLGFGASSMVTNARNPFYSGNKDEKKYESVNALVLQPGISYERKFGENTQLLLGFDLQYSPYKMEGALREDIGSLYCMPRIMFTF